MKDVSGTFTLHADRGPFESIPIGTQFTISMLVPEEE